MPELPIFSINEKEKEFLSLKLQTPKALLPKELKEIDFEKIPLGKSIAVLKLIAAYGILYFRDKRLVMDLFSKNRFFYFVELKAEKLWLSGRIQCKDQIIELGSLDYLAKGESCWFIKGINLKLFESDASWNEIKKLPFAITQEELRRLLKENNSEVQLSDPKLLLGQDPTPIIVLKDKSAGFAELWFDYGEGNKANRNDPFNNHSFTRNITLEMNLEKDFLESDYTKRPEGNYYCPLDRVVTALSFLIDVGFNVVDPEGKKVLTETSREWEAEEREGSIQVFGKLNFQDAQVNLSDAASAHLRGEKFFALSDSSVGLLSGLNSIAKIAEEGEIVSSAITLKKSQLGALFEADSQIQLSNSLQSLKADLLLPKGQLPSLDSFKGVLRPYQEAGVRWLFSLYQNNLSGALADDMGLGKTVQVLAFLSLLKAGRRHLIVVPTSLLFNWQTECRRFTPTLPLYLHHGISRKAELPASGIILTTFGILRSDKELFEKLEVDCLIVDEAQLIKNRATLALAVLMSVKSSFRLSLSGTLVENRLEELFTHFRFLLPDLLNDLENTRSLKHIEKKIRPFLLRRKKEEVAQDLPPKIEQLVYLEMNEPQKECYDAFLSAFKQNLLKKVRLDGVSKHRMEIFEVLLRLRQIACHPSLVFPENVQESAKFNLLLTDIEAVISEGRKALIFSQFSKMLQIMAKEFNKRGLRFSYLDGSTTNREKVVEEFQVASNIPLFLISLKAGGVGLNLTAADTVFIYDPWWNDSVENQAINRAHRIGSKRTVLAKRYITLGTVEEKMMILKSKKNALIEKLFEMSDLDELSEEDILSLLE